MQGKLWTIGLILVVVGGAATAAVFWPTGPAEAPAGPDDAVTTPLTEPQAVMPAEDTATSRAQPDTTVIRAVDIAGVNAAYTFAATVPASWQAEAVAATEGINFYDPAAAGATNLEKSQIFMRYFEANEFLTLSTVTIHDQAPQTINGRPAVRYDIEKKAGIAPFASQPAWRSERHIVTDIRVADTSPSVFYVIAKRPELSEETYQQFLQQLEVVLNENTAASASSEIPWPVAEFTQRITKKPFGIYITPQNSPVQPERFTGWHTGADVEYADVAGDVPVTAIADGRVLLARSASGYGGVAAIQHRINGENVVALYGHLDPTSLPTAGSSLAAGQRIGILGEHASSETDGERKHLHFAVLKGTQADIRGYVGSEAELAAWHDPVQFLTK